MVRDVTGRNWLVCDREVRYLPVPSVLAARPFFFVLLEANGKYSI
jgi:hypothetical protein